MPGIARPYGGASTPPCYPWPPLIAGANGQNAGFVGVGDEAGGAGYPPAVAPFNKYWSPPVAPHWQVQAPRLFNIPQVFPQSVHTAPSHWDKDAAELAERGTIRLVVGEPVEYWSTTNNLWVPTFITQVDLDNATIAVNVKTGDMMPLKGLRKVRPPTIPEAKHLKWVKKVLQEANVSKEALHTFDRHKVENRQGKMVVTLREARALGISMDEKLHICGTMTYIYDNLNRREDRSFDEAAFEGFFWDCLWKVDQSFGRMLRKEQYGIMKNKASFFACYTLSRRLGKGTFGEVHKGRSVKNPEHAYAVKIIPREPGDLSLDAEISYLKELDHPHIVKLYEHFEESGKVYLVMDFCSGGELNAMVQRGCPPLPEEFIAHVMRQLLQAIGHVHDRGILHLDLKSANILLMPDRKTLPPSKVAVDATIARAQDRPHVMVIDLGVAQISQACKDGDPCGTPATMAPEVWWGDMTPAADVFSMGVVLFEMLSNSYPFACGCNAQQAQRYWMSNPQAPWARLSDRSSAAFNLCGRMLMQERQQRAALRQCQEDAFLVEGDIQRKAGIHLEREDKIFRRLGQAHRVSLLHKGVALSIARRWPANQWQTVKRIFRGLDKDGTGRISKPTMAATLREQGVAAFEAEQAAEAMDMSMTGKIDWTEIVAMCIPLDHQALEDDLKQVFKLADGDGDNLLSKSELASILPMDNALALVQAEELLKEVTKSSSSSAKVDWWMFRAHFAKDVTPKPWVDPRGRQQQPQRQQQQQQPDQAAAEIKRGAGAQDDQVGYNLDQPGIVAQAEQQFVACWARSRTVGNRLYQGAAAGMVEAEVRQARGMAPEAQPGIDARRKPEQERTPQRPLMENFFEPMLRRVSGNGNAVRDGQNKELQEKLERLAEMGFNDRARCKDLLQRHDNDVDRVVAAICEKAW